MLQPVKDIDEYTRIKKTLRNKFDAERTGDQHLFIEQSKLLQPLIKPLLSTQEQTVKAIQERPHRPAIMPAVISQTSGSTFASLPAEHLRRLEPQHDSGGTS